jgi:hypothetical protein
MREVEIGSKILNHVCFSPFPQMLNKNRLWQTDQFSQHNAQNFKRSLHQGILERQIENRMLFIAIFLPVCFREEEQQ